MFNLSNKLEFERKLIPSEKFPGFFHLQVITAADGKPRRVQAPSEGAVAPDLSAALGLQAPIEVEIGCGKGGFMVDYCGRNPAQPFIGIENEYPIAVYAASRLAKRPALTGARVIFGDAFYFLRDFVPDSAIKTFHMYFPDPWPKKRHLKRRLMTDRFLEQIRRTAIVGAEFFWATDYTEYHEAAMELFQGLPWMSLTNSDASPTLGIMTNFEKKYVAEGRKIHRISAVIGKN